MVLNIDADYENVLIGKEKKVGTYHFYGSEPGGSNQQIAINLIKYALETLLEWSEEDVVKKLDMYILKKMKLQPILKYIDFPDEVTKTNIRYLLSLLYPERIKLNKNKLIVETYQKVMTDNYNFPRDYFVGIEGFYRFCACLRFLIDSYKPAVNVDDLYKFFLSPKGKEFLKTYHLSIPATLLDLDFKQAIFTITEDWPNSQLFYSFYTFKEAYGDCRSPML